MSSLCGATCEYLGEREKTYPNSDTPSERKLNRAQRAYPGGVLFLATTAAAF